MIEATQKRYIIKSTEQESVSSGGIIMKSNDETQLGEIAHAGPDIENPLPVGTKVVVNWPSTLPVKINNQRMFIVESDNILAVMN